MAAVLYRLGRVSARHHWIVIGLWLVLAVGAVAAASSAGSQTSDNLSLPGTGSTQSQDLLSGKLPEQAYGSNPVVVHTDKGKLTDSGPKKAIESSVTALGKAVSKPATESSEVVGLTAAVIILLFAFGTVTAMALPIVTAVVGLVISLSAIGLLGHAIEVPSVGATLATMIGLGVGIDYALFIVTRHKLQLADGMEREREESIARATATAGGAVAFAGGWGGAAAGHGDRGLRGHPGRAGGPGAQPPSGPVRRLRGAEIDRATQGLRPADRRVQRGPERPAADRRAARIPREGRPEEPGQARRPAEADRPATAAGRAAGPAAGPGEAEDRLPAAAARHAEEAGRESRHRHPPDGAVQRHLEGARDQVGVAGGAGQEGRQRGVHRHRHHRAVGPQDRDHRAQPARLGDPEGGQRNRRDGLRGRADRGLHRPGRPHLVEAAVHDRHRGRAELHRAAAGVPVGADAAEGRRGQPAVGGRRLRRGHVRLPGGPRRHADRAGRGDPDSQLRAAAHVRDLVRPVDGL